MRGFPTFGEDKGPFIPTPKEGFPLSLSNIAPEPHRQPEG